MNAGRGLVPEVRARMEWAMRVAGTYGLVPEVTSTLRNYYEQLQLYRRYVAGHSQFPANRPGDSAHNYGLAWDSVVPAFWLALWTTIREAAGFYVPPNDVIHAEVPGWRKFVRYR